MKYFISAVVIIVVVVIGIGFFFVGTPAQERLRRFDETRVNDLMMTQNNIIAYWQAKKKLPAGLSELNDSTRGVFVPRDPVTGGEYGYETTGELSFRLCADFATSVSSTASIADRKPYPADYYGFYGIADGDNWSHGTGTVCFDRTIDPDFFKPNPEPGV